jgi:hypothetical protein
MTHALVHTRYKILLVQQMLHCMAHKHYAKMLAACRCDTQRTNHPCQYDLQGMADKY